MQNYWQKEIETASRDQITAWQNERLCNTVEHVYENVELYRRRMDEAGVKPGDIKTIEDITKLPFTCKQDLRDTYPYGMFAVPMSEVVRLHASSGTTGKQIVVGYTKEDLEIWEDICARQLVAAGATKEDKIHISYGYGLFTGGLGLHGGAQRLGATAIPVSSGNTARQITILQDFGSDFLCCTPSYAMYIAETMENEGIDTSRLPLRGGIFGAEPWTEEMRKQIEELLGINAYDVYGLTEIAGPGVGFECVAKHGMHVSEDHVIPEIIDPVTEQPLPYRTPGELVFTTITKEGMPMLRYRTHDICTLDDTPCECGRTLVRMGRITGRTDDMIVVRGVNVFPTQIESVLVGLEGVAPHYLLVVDRVHSADTLEVQVEMTEDMVSDTVSHIQGLARTIHERIKSVVGISTDVKLVAPKSIPRSEGKAKRVIDKRKL